jgi:hypothetical protein
MIENIESISYEGIDSVELLNDSIFIEIAHKRIDSAIADIKEKLITAIAIQTNKTNKTEFRDLVIAELDTMLANFKDEFKKSVAILSHLSDIENKTNLATAMNWYTSINEKITNELYQVLNILLNKIKTIE